MVADGALLSLLHLADTLFPTGGFAHSDGLEAATTSGAVSSRDDLRDWLRAQLHGPLRTLDGPGLAAAARHWSAGDWTALERLDDELYAMRAARSARQAVRGMGTRLLNTWQAIRPSADLGAFLARRGPLGPTLPVAFAIACAGSAVPLPDSLQAFLYARLAGSISAAMRLMAIGQTGAHTVLAELLGEVPAVAAAILEDDAAPAVFAPALDIAVMTHQYAHARLFRS